MKLYMALCGGVSRCVAMCGVALRGCMLLHMALCSDVWGCAWLHVLESTYFL